MAQGLLLLMLITSFVVKATASDELNITPTCIRDLSWVPGYRRQVLLRILNDINYPSWTSKDRSHLTLPRGTPFAFACGACYSPWKTPVLSFRATGTQAIFSQVLSCNSRLEHKVNSRTYCVVSYGLTQPLQDGGFLECELNRNGKLTRERVTYSTVEVDTESLAVEEVYANYEGFVKLSCPQIPVENVKNFVYVWHFPNGQNGIVTQSLRKEIVLRGRPKPYEVECSTYDTYNPTKVWKKSYIIHSEVQEWDNSVNALNLDREAGGSHAMSLANISIIAGVTVVILLLISVLIAVFRETRLSRRRRANMRESKKFTGIER